MKTIEKKIQIQSYINNSFDTIFHDIKLAVFDLETTGLNPSYCSIILSGIILINGTEGTLVQHFADQVSAEDERQLIAATLETLKDVDVVVTYNGKHFDIPFIETRMKACDMGRRINELPLYNLDLYLFINGHSHLRDLLPDLKQKTLEVFMGIGGHRDDEISGGDCVGYYAKYLQSHNPDLARKILLHNSDDVEQLYKLLPILSKVDLFKALYKIGFPIKTGRVGLFPDVAISQIILNSNNLIIKGKQKGHILDYISFETEETPYKTVFSKDLAQWEITLPIEKKMNALIVDAKGMLHDYNSLKIFPTYESGFLILKLGADMYYQEAVAFVKLLLETISNRM